MDPFEVYAYWDSWRTSPNLTLTLTLTVFNSLPPKIRLSLNRHFQAPPKDSPVYNALGLSASKRLCTKDITGAI